MTAHATLPTATYATATRSDLRAPLASRIDNVHSIEALTIRIRPIASDDPDDDPNDTAAAFGLVDDDFVADMCDDIYHRSAVGRVLQVLTERERTVLMLRFGLIDEPLTLQEIGDSWGVTRERIRQIEAKAMQRARFVLGVRLPTAEPTPDLNTTDVSCRLFTKAELQPLPEQHAA